MHAERFQQIAYELIKISSDQKLGVFRVCDDEICFGNI